MLLCHVLVCPFLVSLEPFSRDNSACALVMCMCAEATACSSQDKRRVSLPRLHDKHSRARTATLDIIRVLEFDPRLLKSGVVVMSDDAPASTALLFIKGAPSVIKDTVVASSIPSGFAKVDHMRLCKTRLTAYAMFCIQYCHRDLMSAMLGMLSVSHPSCLCECCSAVSILVTSASGHANSWYVQHACH